MHHTLCPSLSSFPFPFQSRPPDYLSFVCSSSLHLASLCLPPEIDQAWRRYYHFAEEGYTKAQPWTAEEVEEEDTCFQETILHFLV